ncbi:type II secretion system F family protein [Thermobifida halotolerans]|uniref:Type II secretion system F family protein n=1 Tax=Thermobifida halotolerans TaxID=483545 RepID=A0A399G176_9ACTN|nr:type II secretion system F family protein [Thermobifida halotolerans]UOE18001.1 type II secretion system F family protein [Thermobifida halotolerans]
MTLGLPLALVAGLVGALSVACFLWGAHLVTRPTAVAEDFVPALPKKKREGTFLLHRITELLGHPFGATLMDLLGPEGQARIQKRIDEAGRPGGITVLRYVRRKTGEVLLYGTLGILFLLNDSPMIALVVLAFTLLSDIVLYTAKQQRMDEIQKQLPDFLDVLAVTVSAGLSFRQALARVADAMPGLLASEFRLALRQMELGSSRREAFETLRRRNPNESLGRFVSAFQQAEDLGAPLAQTLLNISLDMRREDAQYQRRKAVRLNPRVTVITAATMLPGLLLLIGGGLFLGSGINLAAFFG